MFMELAYHMAIVAYHSCPRLERLVARTCVLAYTREAVCQGHQLMKNKCYIMTHVDMAPACLLRNITGSGPFVITERHIRHSER